MVVVVGYGKASTSPAFVASARKYGTASFVFSILGIFIPIVVAIVLTAYSEPVSSILKLHLQRVIVSHLCSYYYHNDYYCTTIANKNKKLAHIGVNLFGIRGTKGRI